MDNISFTWKFIKISRTFNHESWPIIFKFRINEMSIQLPVADKTKNNIIHPKIYV